MPAFKFLPLVFVLSVAGCAAPRQPSHPPQEIAQAERVAYVECAVRTAFMAPRVRAVAVNRLARAAMAACELQRRALLAGAMRDLDAAPDAAQAASLHLRQIEDALAERLALHLYRRAVSELSSAAGRDI